MNKVVVIDTETGGLNPQTDSILSLGAVVLNPDGSLGETFYVLINEGTNRHVTEDALKVNGISLSMIDTNGVTPSMAVTMFSEFLLRNEIPRKTELAGHNIAGFDMGFIRRLYCLAGVRMPFDYHTLDTMSVALFWRWTGHVPVSRVSLDALAKHFSIVVREPGAIHNSLEDAVATAKLLAIFREMAGSLGSHEVS